MRYHCYHFAVPSQVGDVKTVSSIRKRKRIPPPWYKQGGGGGGRGAKGGVGLLQLIPWVFAVLHYFGHFVPLIDSLSCDLQGKVNIIG